MKLIKIGSSPSCDIVLNSEFVSSHHADITVLDNGEIILEDKNSTNGTFVGSKRIQPNQEVSVKRGDYIRFADTDIAWGRIPSPDNNKKYKRIVNIGSNYRNDIVINSSTVSRYHATLKVEKNGKAYLVDNGSKNGTQVNGVRIQGSTRIKRGDNVMCGGEDISEQLKQFLPSSVPGWAWVVGGVAAVAAVVAAVWITTPPPPIVKPEQVRPTVVYVRAAYHYEVTIEDNPLVGEAKELLVKTTNAQPYQATAFFIDEEGRMATNRHVALPWDEAYREEGETEALREAYKSWLLKQFEVPSFELLLDANQQYNALLKLQRTELGMALLESSENIAEVRSKINIILSSKINISGKIDYITVGMPGQNYTHSDEFQRCYVVSESGTKDIDLAILQLNNKRTPESLVHGKTKEGLPIVILDPRKAVEETLVPLRDQYRVIGYPLGLLWGLDENTHALEPTIKNTTCAKQPSKYNFEFDASSYGGSSGSPIFDVKGQLIGILSSGFAGTPVTFAVHAKYLKQMYEDEVGK